MEKDKIVIAGSCRTPIAKTGGRPGVLSSIAARQLLKLCFEETIQRSNLNPRKINEVFAGQVGQGSDAPNIARVAALDAGIPKEVPAMTVQRNCGSGLQAITSACQAIKAGDGKMYLAGGVESMSNIPYVLPRLRYGAGLGSVLAVDGLMHGLTDPVTGELMAATAQNIADQYNINREEQDAFAARSHKLALEAQEDDLFEDQIMPVKVGGRIGTVYEDDGIDPQFTDVQIYKSITHQNTRIAFFPDEVTGELRTTTVHAKNSCQLSDGASSMLVMTELVATELGITPEAEILSYAFAGCDPSFMGLGPVYATPIALGQARLSINNIDYVELNEAFAAQALGCQRLLEIPDEKLNIYGGAIALGHPIGATAALLVVKMISLLKDKNAELGLVTMCIGGGQGGAIIIRNLQ